MRQIVLFAASLLTIAMGIGIQSQLLLSGDVSYLMQAAEQLSLKERYATHIFETNPPLILYLYMPAVWLIKHVSWTPVFALRSYVLILSLLSAAQSYVFLKKLINPEEKQVFYAVFITLLFAFFILPLDSFGQREHLLMILIMPYLLLQALNLENKYVAKTVRVLVGFVAALGFALKPFFLIPWMLIELGVIIKRRSLRALFRIESSLIVGVVILYFFSILLFQPEYIKIIWPLVQHYYFPFAKETWSLLFSPPYVMFCIAIAGSYCFFYAYDQYANISLIGWLALIGFIVAFLCVRTSWYYHVLPALSLAYLMVALWLSQYLRFSPFKIGDGIVMGFVILAILGVPLYNGFLMLHYKKAMAHQSAALAIARYINSKPGPHSLFCIPIGTADCFPLVYLTHGVYHSRFPSLWWYRGLRKTVGNTILDQHYLLASLADDLKINQPHWIIFNESIFKNDNMLDYFSQNEAFREIWKSYHYKTTIEAYQIYEKGLPA